MIKLSDVLFTPIDIPLIPFKEDILNSFEEDTPYAWWREETLLGERDLNTPFGARNEDWSSRAKQKYNDLILFLEDHLPFRQLLYVRLARAKKDVWPHVDENYVEAPFSHHMRATQEFVDHQNKLEPIGYRFLISGNRTSFYLCQNYDPLYRNNTPGKKVFCTLPKESDFFLIQNSRYPHGVDLMPGDENRIVGFVLGFLDEKKHLNLIERSRKKFSAYVIEKKDLA